MNKIEAARVMIAISETADGLERVAMWLDSIATEYAAMKEHEDYLASLPGCAQPLDGGVEALRVQVEGWRDSHRTQARALKAALK